jgi:hypothetical protein
VRPLAAALACVAVLATACGEDDERAAAPALADLTVRVDRDGAGGSAARAARVRCAEATDSDVCAHVAALTAEHFAPTPDDVACTQQYGGPDTATVTGTLRGEAIDARFSRENGCEIARWEKVAALLEAAG